MAFDAELAFLRRHGEAVVLEAEHGAKVAVSPKYQGRVMTSAVGPNERSLGWINHAFIEAGKTGTQFDNYGGEDRFWLGPEGGQFALYFAPGQPFDLSAWQTPAAFQEGSWAVVEKGSRSISMRQSMSLENYSGTKFTLDVGRKVSLLSREDVARFINTAIPEGVKWVAFESNNRVTHRGEQPWVEAEGLLSIWILGMYSPSADTQVIIPFDPDAEGPIVNDAYFGKVPPDRLKVNAKAGYLLFVCDGQYRSKIGLGPKRAQSMAGSYSPSSNLLTIIHYDKPKGQTRYVNSMWEHQKAPFAGDVLNSYNDGPPAPGKPSLGGFYELETSSPALALAPGASAEHTHRTFHFVGEKASLDRIAKASLGVSLDAVAP